LLDLALNFLFAVVRHTSPQDNSFDNVAGQADVGNKARDAKTLQPLRFRSSLIWIIHLPVPSENLSWRGKKIWKCCSRLADHAHRVDGTRDRTLQEPCSGVGALSELAENTAVFKAHR